MPDDHSSQWPPDGEEVNKEYWRLVSSRVNDLSKNEIACRQFREMLGAFGERLEGIGKHLCDLSGRLRAVEETQSQSISPARDQQQAAGDGRSEEQPRINE